MLLYHGAGSDQTKVLSTPKLFKFVCKIRENYYAINVLKKSTMALKVRYL